MSEATEYPKSLFRFGEEKKVETSGQEARAREQGFTEPYKYQEYPKSLHKGGDRTASEKIVKDKKEEASARKDGFLTIHEVEAGERAAA